MKKLIIALSLIGLAGCAAPPPGPPNYGSRVNSADPGAWHVVSVTPVPLGTGAQVAAHGEVGAVNNVADDPPPASAMAAAPAAAPATTSQPVYVQQPIYVQQPVYVPAPVYAPAPIYYSPAPVYASPYWWPPISIGLGFNWSHWSGGGGGHGWGGHGGGHGWSGHGGGHGH
jgi:hypothetical protein